jgi:L-asparagine oxygenase
LKRGIRKARRSRPPRRSVIDCSRIHRRLQTLCDRLSADPYENTEAFLRQAAFAARSLPRGLRQALDAFADRGNREGYLLLRGFPVAENPGAEACLALIASRLGDLVGYLQEKEGALFHDVAPERSQEREQSASGSKVPLALHTERCFHPYLPSHVMLLCLRPDPGQRARTEIASVRNMMPFLPEKHLPVLFEPAFRTGIDYSFGNTATEKGNGPVLSVLYGGRDDPGLRYDLDLMVGLTAQARVALEAVKRAARKACTSIRLVAGDLLIIDNRRAAHGRSSFNPRYDGRDRLLKRAYLVNDLQTIKSDRRPGERIIRTRF